MNKIERDWFFHAPFSFGQLLNNSCGIFRRDVSVNKLVDIICFKIEMQLFADIGSEKYLPVLEVDFHGDGF